MLVGLHLDSRGGHPENGKNVGRQAQFWDQDEVRGTGWHPVIYVGEKGGESPPELSGTGPAKKEREREFSEAGFLAAAGSSVPPHAAPDPVRGSRVLYHGMAGPRRKCAGAPKTRKMWKRAKFLKFSKFHEIW